MIAWPFRCDTKRKFCASPTDNSGAFIGAPRPPAHALQVLLTPDDGERNSGRLVFFPSIIRRRRRWYGSSQISHSCGRDKNVSDTTGAELADWRDQVFATLKNAEIRQVGYVPDAGHARLIELCPSDPGMRAVPLTTEEEGVALLAGAWLGGQRGVLLMQSSGVGNCVNMLAMTKTCRFPLTMLVAMRGEWAEFNPWQVPMGSKTAAALELCDVLVHRVERAADAAETIGAAIDIAFNGDLATAVLLSQRLIGAKRWVI